MIKKFDFNDLEDLVNRGMIQEKGLERFMLESVKNKINELVEAVNKLTQQQPTPKWKVGDDYFYITFKSDTSYWGTHSGRITTTTLEDINNGDTNYFKTKEQAQQALNEILQTMRKYQ